MRKSKLPIPQYSIRLAIICDANALSDGGSICSFEQQGGQVNEWKWTLYWMMMMMCLVTLSLNFKQRDAKSHPIQ